MVEKVKENDTVLIPGDFSWETYLEDTYKDFEFIKVLTLDEYKNLITA